MKIPPVKGTRDFYPADMIRHNWIIDGWKRVSVRNGFEEYGGPIFEYLQMYQIKSGDEIVEQLFSLKDRGDRDLAIRPEITPTLARMVNQQFSSLPKPIKWFSVPRLCRAERPQKGRLREFFQWNIDIIGVDDVLADAEVMFTTLDYLRDVGLKPGDIKLRTSSRKLLAAVLAKAGIAEDKTGSLYSLLDKKSKLPRETFIALLKEQVPDQTAADKILAFVEATELSAIEKMFGRDAEIEEAINELLELSRLLNLMGVGGYNVFDPSIIRGLAYYTGIVFEVHDARGQLRAICGGGRFDNLLKDFGGPEVPATGMGMGDCVLEILLEQRGLLDKNLPPRQLDYFVAAVPNVSISDSAGNAIDIKDEVIRLTARLRQEGYLAQFSYSPTNLSRQLKEAAARNAQFCIIVGEEFKDGKVTVKDMATGSQKLQKPEELLA